MRNSVKCGVAGVGLGVCALLVIANLGTFQSASYSFSPRQDTYRRADDQYRNPHSAYVTTRLENKESVNYQTQHPSDGKSGQSLPPSSPGAVPEPRNTVPQQAVMTTGHASGRGQLVSTLHAREKIKVGQLPVWWQESWGRSAVFGLSGQFVGDKPLFSACKKPRSSRTLYTFVEPQGQYLPPEVSKNPCWYELPSTKKGLHCVPYAYLVGVAKCGTTDMHKRLRRHPEFSEGTLKEYHWWERYRYGDYDIEDPVKTVDLKGGEPFEEYMKKVTGDDLDKQQRDLINNGTSRRIFVDFSPSYMWDAQNWYVLDGNQGCGEPRMVIGQHIYHLWPPAKIIMTFRHPTPRLYSRFLSRIHRTPELKNVDVNDFHAFVKQSIQLYENCFRQKSKSIRHCAYDINIYKDAMVRLVEGMYPVFMEDWLRIFPANQTYIMRYEDYGGHERKRLQELIDFLGLSHLDERGWGRLLSMGPVNHGTDEYNKYGSMLPKTKKLLDDFYQPFVDQFAKIVNDERFLWKDVYQ